MVRARNLITNNLPNAYAADAVSLRRETHIESAYRTRVYRIRVYMYMTRTLYAPEIYTTQIYAEYRKAITTFTESIQL